MDGRSDGVRPLQIGDVSPGVGFARRSSQGTIVYQNSSEVELFMEAQKTEPLAWYRRKLREKGLREIIVGHWRWYQSRIPDGQLACRQARRAFWQSSHGAWGDTVCRQSWEHPSQEHSVLQDYEIAEHDFSHAATWTGPCRLSSWAAPMAGCLCDEQAAGETRRTRGGRMQPSPSANSEEEPRNQPVPVRDRSQPHWPTARRRYPSPSSNTS